MNCEQIKGELTSYASGNLTEAERAEIGLHLQECPGCKTELERLESLFSACRALPQVEPSAQFTSNVMQHLTQRKAAYRRPLAPPEPLWAKVRAFLWRPAFGVSALAHAAILLVLAFVVAQATGVFDPDVPDNSFTLVSSHYITDSDRKLPKRSGECALMANVVTLAGYVDDGPVYLQSDRENRYVGVLPEALFQDELGKMFVVGLPRADVRNGKLSIPEEMRASVFGQDKTVVALLLDDRVELWAGSKYEAFKKINTTSKSGYRPLAFISLQ